MQGAGAAGSAAAAPSEMDFATVLATFSPELREEVLLTSEEDLINSLPPALLAEAQALRQRVMQAYRSASQALPWSLQVAVTAQQGCMSRPA